VADESEGAFLLQWADMLGGERWIAVRRGGAYSIAFPIDKVLAQFPGKIMVKPGESYP